MRTLDLVELSQPSIEVMFELGIERRHRALLDDQPHEVVDCLDRIGELHQSSGASVALLEPPRVDLTPASRRQRARRLCPADQSD